MGKQRGSQCQRCALDRLAEVASAHVFIDIDGMRVLVMPRGQSARSCPAAGRRQMSRDPGELEREREGC
jgi:hypothetical protein